MPPLVVPDEALVLNLQPVHDAFRKSSSLRRHIDSTLHVQRSTGDSPKSYRVRHSSPCRFAGRAHAAGVCRCPACSTRLGTRHSVFSQPLPLMKEAWLHHVCVVVNDESTWRTARCEKSSLGVAFLTQLPAMFSMRKVVRPWRSSSSVYV